LPRLNAKTIRLLDHPRAINQICTLERRTMRGGRDTIDHPPGTHDDLANAIAGLCGIAGTRRYRYPTSADCVATQDPRGRVEFTNSDRLFFILMYRWFGRSSIPSQSSGPRRWCAGIVPDFVATGSLGIQEVARQSMPKCGH
jgi:hypothetical protein